MKAVLPEQVELARVVNYFGSEEGRNGRFMIQGPCGCTLRVTAYDGEQSGWEQVSVATERRRSPNWPEMCFVKDLFWDEEECVVQYHPPRSQYVKMHRYCLHLWKPKKTPLPAPPAGLVGIIGIGPEETQAWVDAMVADLVRAAQ